MIKVELAIESVDDLQKVVDLLSRGIDLVQSSYMAEDCQADIELIEDTGRNAYNLTDLSLSSESSAAEVTQTTAGNPIDALSNGFKCRGTGASSNASGGTYIYAVFAENPFKYSNAR